MSVKIVRVFFFEKKMPLNILNWFENALEKLFTLISHLINNNKRIRVRKMTIIRMKFVLVWIH